MVEAQTRRIRAWILAETTQSQVKIWGLSVAERLRRALLALGFPREQISVGPSSAVQGQEDLFLLFRSDYVFDDRLIRALTTAPATILVLDKQAVAAQVPRSHLHEVLKFFACVQPQWEAVHVSGLQVVTPLELAPAYTAALRKTEPPYLLPASPEHVEAIEARLFSASYKGVTDLVTKWVWPKPARMVTRQLAYAGVHPNTVTILSWLLVILAAWLFAQGHFGLGLAAAWIMTFLDTVDGKLARVTLTSSTVGHVLDHGLDLVHPPFWYLAWAFGLMGNAFWVDTATLIIVTGYIVGRLLEGLFMLAFKMETHSWRPIDSFFRTITARRNPNLILLTAGTLISRPDWGFLLVAGWTVCSIGFHAVRLLQAGVYYWQGHIIEEWQGKLSTPASSDHATRTATDQSESLA